MDTPENDNIDFDDYEAVEAAVNARLTAEELTIIRLTITGTAAIEDYLRDH